MAYLQARHDATEIEKSHQELTDKVNKLSQSQASTLKALSDAMNSTTMDKDEKNRAIAEVRAELNAINKLYDDAISSEEYKTAINSNRIAQNKVDAAYRHAEAESSKLSLMQPGYTFDFGDL